MNIRSLFLIAATTTCVAAAASQSQPSPVTVQVSENAQKLDLSVKTTSVPYWELPEYEQKEAVKYKARKYADRSAFGVMALLGHAMLDPWIKNMSASMRNEIVGTSALPLLYFAHLGSLALATALFTINLGTDENMQEFTEEQKDSVYASKLVSLVGLGGVVSAVAYKALVAAEWMPLGAK